MSDTDNCVVTIYNSLVNLIRYFSFCSIKDKNSIITEDDFSMDMGSDDENNIEIINDYMDKV